MYCSSCGIEVTQELNYCNRCGANLYPASLAPQVVAPPVKLTGPTIALAVMVVCSLAAIFNSADRLALRGVHPAAIAWMVIIGLMTLFGITGLVIRLLANLLKNSSTAAAAVPQYQRPAQLRQPQPNPQLQAPQTGPMQAPNSSVTDHTTRTFDPVYRERSQKGN
jgi:hypothetical protein